MSKSTSINIRIDEEAKVALQNQAEAAGLSLSEYMLRSCQDQRIIVLEEGKEIAAGLHRICMELQKPKNTSAQIATEVDKISIALNGISERLSDFSTGEEDEECR